MERWDGDLIDTTFSPSNPRKIETGIKYTCDLNYTAVTSIYTPATRHTQQDTPLYPKQQSYDFENSLCHPQEVNRYVGNNSQALFAIAAWHVLLCPRGELLLVFWAVTGRSLAVSGRVRYIRGAAHSALLVPSW